MEITQPYYLFALLLIPVAVLFFIRYRNWRNKVLLQFGEQELVTQLIPGNSIIRPVLKLSLQLTAFALIIFGLANLQSGSSSRTIHHEGIDLAIVLDVSNSMLATDAKPDRLEVAKKFAAQLIEQMPEARIALITFAAVPVLQTPLTIDHSAAQLLLNTITTDAVPEQGSDIGAALQEGIQALPENLQHYRAIVLISDGEDQEEALKQAMETVEKNQIVVCTAGIGSESGTTIPVTENGITTEKKDEQGNLVITRFNPEVLNAIAKSSNGIFVKLTSRDNEAVRKMVLHLDAINKNKFDEQLLVQYESKFQWLLLPALLLLFIDLLISNKKITWFRKRKPL
ncbi:MAG: VWA domain-containing protein [Chitinophagaceae bacterium]|nr:VWA domain-containing protein [Chitinophagaceae bacterium]